MMKKSDADPTAVHAQLLAAYHAQVAAAGVCDLQTARVAWQLASAKLSAGDIAGAEPLLLEVQSTREQLLPSTSDDLYDVYADLAAVHLLRAPSAAKPSVEYALAMDLAVKARGIVSINANSSTSERFHYRMALISGRLGGIHRALGQSAHARECFERAHDTASRLQMDLPRNVKVHVHACLELAADIANSQLQATRMAAKKDGRRTKTEAAAGVSPATASTAATTAATTPASRTSAPDLYLAAIRALETHALTELPFMAHAEAGLALHYMAEAEALHQLMMQQSAQPSPPQTSASASAAASPSAASTAPTTAKEKSVQIQELLHRAVKLTTQALTRYQKIGGEHSADVATMCYNLGGLHVRLGDLASARPFLSRALRIRQKLYGLGHESVAKIREELHQLEKNAGATAATTGGAAATGSASARASANGASNKRSSLPTPSPSTPQHLTARKGRALVPSTARQQPVATPLPPSAPATARLSAQRVHAVSAAQPGGSQSARGTGAAAVRTIKQSPLTSSAASTPATSFKSVSASAATSAVPAPAVAVSPSAPSAGPAVAKPPAALAVTVLHKAPSQSQLLTFPAASAHPASTEKAPAAVPFAVASLATPAASAMPVTTPVPSPVTAVSDAPVLARPKSILLRRGTADAAALAAVSSAAKPSPSPAIAATPAASTTPAAVSAAPTPVLVRPGSAKITIHRTASKAALLPAAASNGAAVAEASAPAVAANNDDTIASSTSSAAASSSATAGGPSLSRSGSVYVLRPKSAAATRPAVASAVTLEVAPTEPSASVSTSPALIAAAVPTVISPHHVEIDGAVVDVRFMSF